MRVFTKDSAFYWLDNGQLTADEIELSGVDRIACAPSGAVDVTDYAEDIKVYSGTHTPSWANGELVWNEKAIELSTQDQIYELEASITARRWREAYLGDEDAKEFIANINAQIESLRSEL